MECSKGTLNEQILEGLLLASSKTFPLAIPLIQSNLKNHVTLGNLKPIQINQFENKQTIRVSRGKSVNHLLHVSWRYQVRRRFNVFFVDFFI